MTPRLVFPLVAIAAVSFGLLYHGQGEHSQASSGTIRPQLSQMHADSQATQPFPSFQPKYGPPSWWITGNANDRARYPIFEINYDADMASATYPAVCKTLSDCPWKAFSFKTETTKYLEAAIRYAFAGNLEVDWEIQKNTQGRKWTHAPYMHLDIVKPVIKPCVQPCAEEIEEKVAREFIHGMTRERTATLSELVYQGKKIAVSKPDKEFQNWAISFYNERGASHLAKVWDEMINPKSGTPNPKNFPSKGFPDGTMAVKLLFTAAKPTDVPYLAGSVEWNADIGNEVSERAKEREVKGEQESDCSNLSNCFTQMRLLQVDLAIRDDRKNLEESPTGWVFATFTYDSKAPPFISYTYPDQETDPNKEKIKSWLRIVPLGLMFGNDPTVQIGGKLKETVINGGLRIPQHYGCGAGNNRRLNGPVDNPASSCISCHAQAETPRNLDIGSIPYGCLRCDSKFNIAEWFRNINPRKPDSFFTDPTLTISTPQREIISLDFSLQLREGIRRYCIESYNSRSNSCKLVFQQGDRVTSVTKDGPHAFPIQ